MSAAETINGILRNLPSGFRFYPTDEELVSYLKLKIQGADSKVNIISEVDVCKLEPWDLPYLSVMKTEDRVWFFFSPPSYKYSKGCRSNRATKAGYWKPTGQDHDIKSGTNKEVIGTRKTLVFHMGRGRTAIRTNWVMHEYRADIANQAYVLCRLKEKKYEKKIKRKKKKGHISSSEDPADTAIHQNDPANNTTFGPESSCHSSNIASDIGNSQAEKMTSYVRTSESMTNISSFLASYPQDDPQLDGLFNDTTFTPLDPDWFLDIENELRLDLSSPSGFDVISYESMQVSDGDDTNFADGLIVDPDEYHSEGLASQRSSIIENPNIYKASVEGYGKDGGSSMFAKPLLLQDCCLEVKDGAYGSVTDLLQNKKDGIVTQNPYTNSKLSSIWNEPVGMNQRGSFGSPETAIATRKPSSSPGYLVYLFVGILLFMVLNIAVMLLGIRKRLKPFP